MIPQVVIDKEAADFVVNARNYYRDLRKELGYERQWKEAEDSYFNGTADYYKGLSRVRVPALFQAVERVVPKMDKVNFPPDGNFFEARAKQKDNQIQEEDAEEVTALIRQQLIDSNIRMKLVPEYRSLCIYGTTFTKTFWNHKIKERFKRVDGQRVKVYETVIDNPDFYCPSIWDIYLDPSDENLDGDVIEREVTDFQIVKDNEMYEDGGNIYGVYRNIDQITSFNYIEQSPERDSSEEVRSIQRKKYAPHEKKVQLLHFQGRVPKYFLTRSEADKQSGDYVDNGLICVCESGDQAVTLRISDNPFDHQEKFYFATPYIKVPGRLYGIGLITPNISLEAELNTLRNQAMDCRTQMLRKKWLRDRGAEIPDAQLNDQANLIIDTQDMNGLRELPQQDFTSVTIAAEQNIKRDIEDSTVSKLLGGTPSGGSLDRTAAGVATVVQGGLERFELVATNFEESKLKNLIRHYWYLNQQFLPEGRDVEITGGQIVRVYPDEINIQDLDFNFVGIKGLGEKEYKVNAVNILLQNLTPYIPLGLDPLPVLFRFFKLVGMGDLEAEVDKRPQNQLEYSPEGEIQLLQMGQKVKIDLNDNHEAYIQAYQQLLQSPELPDNVRQNTTEAMGQRLLAMQVLKANPEIVAEVKQQINDFKR